MIKTIQLFFWREMSTYPFINNFLSLVSRIYKLQSHNAQSKIDFDMLSRSRHFQCNYIRKSSAREHNKNPGNYVVKNMSLCLQNCFFLLSRAKAGMPRDLKYGKSSRSNKNTPQSAFTSGDCEKNAVRHSWYENINRTTLDLGVLHNFLLAFFLEGKGM